MDSLLSARRALVALTSLGALVAASAQPALAHPYDGSRPHDSTQAALEAIVAEGTPGVIAEVTTGRRTWRSVVGVADVDNQRPRRTDERFRIASMTKPFTATLLMQLEADGLLSLDDSIEQWLPGVVRGSNYRPERITVRSLLNHTSGIFNYNNDEAFRARYAGDEFDKNRFNTVPPRELVNIAIAHPAVFQPGERGWEYSDTNYILAGMVIEKVTDSSYERQVEERIIKPFGLHDTVVPGTSPKLPRPHAIHYSTLFEDPPAPVRDVTEFNPTVAWSAGTIISTTADLNRFVSLLLRGKVLPPAQQRAMFDIVSVEGDTGHGGPQDRYGLGIRKFKVTDGCWVWGHGGMIPGSASRVAASRDGRHVLTMNRNADWGDQQLEDAVVEAEFCDR